MKLVDNSYASNIIPSLFGTIGHSLLLIFFTLSTYIFHKKYHVAFNHDLYYLNNTCISKDSKISYWLSNDYNLPPTAH